MNKTHDEYRTLVYSTPASTSQITAQVDPGKSLLGQDSEKLIRIAGRFGYRRNWNGPFSAIDVSFPLARRW
ncbi:MAG: hypothetical protein QNM00_08410 [Gammaproteobacteria bacterium]|nr:hypothetical protein [Gammaproteobacteria bacterium]